MWKEYLSPVSLDEAVTALNRFQNRARIVAGATDLMLELERGVRTGVDVLIDVTRVPGLDHIQRLDDGMLEIGPLVTHNACVASKLLVEQAWPLPRACYEVGAPQIRNRGTIAGNLITASPANDSITALMVLEAEVRLLSSRGERCCATTVQGARLLARRIVHEHEAVPAQMTDTWLHHGVDGSHGHDRINGVSARLQHLEARTARVGVGRSHHPVLCHECATLGIPCLSRPTEASGEWDHHALLRCLLVLNARVDDDIEEIDDDIDQDVCCSDEQDQTLRKRKVFAGHRLKCQRSYSPPSKHGLHDNSSSKKRSELKPDQGDHRDQCVAERVNKSHPTLTKSLGPRRSYVVLGEDLQ